MTPSTIARAGTAPRTAIVVGAGVAGCSLARELSLAGFAATVLEAGRVGRMGASAVPAALLNPFRGRRARPGPLDLDGLEHVRELAAAMARAGIDPGIELTGVIRLADNERQARYWRSSGSLRELLPPPDQYHAPFGAFLVERGGWLRTGRFLSALLAEARRRGAEVFEDAPVDRVERSGGNWRAWSGDRHWEADLLLVCSGAGHVPGVGLPEMERVAGEIVTLRSDLSLPYPVAGPVYLAAFGGGVTVGGNHRQVNEVDPHAPRRLRDSAVRMVPALESAGIQAVWSGVRARTADHTPLARELATNLWFLGAFGGRGFLTAPLLARSLVARLRSSA